MTRSYKFFMRKFFLMKRLNIPTNQVLKKSVDLLLMNIRREDRISPTVPRSNLMRLPSHHQHEINLDETSRFLTFGLGRAFQSLLVFWVDLAYKLIEAKPHQDINWLYIVRVNLITPLVNGISRGVSCWILLLLLLYLLVKD